MLLEKIGWIKTNVQLPMNKKVYNPRISFDGKYWYLAVGIEINQTVTQRSGTLGIALDGHYPVTLSTGENYTSISSSDKVKKLEKKLNRLKKQYHRKVRMNIDDSLLIKERNLHKLESKIQLIYRKLFNIRVDYWHKVTVSIVKRRPEKVVISYLPLHELMKDQKRKKKLAKECYYELKRQLQYKCEGQNIKFIEVDQNYPCSRICSKCKNICSNASETIDMYHCLQCNNKISKDWNTSLNLIDYKG